MIRKLIEKYNKPVPRYTSYPTVPHWDTNLFTLDYWNLSVKRCFEETNESKGIAIYIHLPFCESLCTYCACNTRITRNHSVESRYIDAVLNEWCTYLNLFEGRPKVREIHLGGGTPTFFSPANLERLLNGILVPCELHPDYEFSFEGHPNNTTEEHLRILHSKGFRRVSYGVQDLNTKVQKAINRIQPLEHVKQVTTWTRNVGYDSVSYDLVYGLPYQTVDSVRDTIQQIIELGPDRISFYSYAHVPWLRPGQRGYEDADLPTDEAKRTLYEVGRELFLNAGYVDIGMDHFARPTDSLALAQKAGRLHRNFMGYTTSQADLLIGLGASAISDSKYAYAQNLKKVEGYQDSLVQNGTAVFKGHLQTNNDMIARRCILDLACNGRLSSDRYEGIVNDELLQELNEMQGEGLIEFTEEGIIVADPGRPFIRNICSVFDFKLRSQEPTSTPIFSKSI